MNTPFYQRVIVLIKSIPKGKVSSYGALADMAGRPRGARQVSWFLKSSSKKENLPWHRVISSSGKISLPKGKGFERQKQALEKEGVVVNENGYIDLERYKWRPSLNKTQDLLKGLPAVVPPYLK